MELTGAAELSWGLLNPTELRATAYRVPATGMKFLCASSLASARVWLC